MSVRSSIVKALRRSETRAAGRPANDNVVPFPKKARSRRGGLKPKVYRRITGDGTGGFVGKSGKNKDYFTKVEINGKTYMRRKDGAYFRLRRDGAWVLTSTPRGAPSSLPDGYRRKKSGYGPAIGVGLAGAAAAGGIYAASRYRKK